MNRLACLVVVGCLVCGRGYGQIGGSLGGGFGGGGLGSGGFSGGGRIGGSGLQGGAGLRSGLGVRNSPITNPAPSLTPSQVLNPRGSLNSGQVLNPEGSLHRPRTGVAPGIDPARGVNAGRTMRQSRYSAPVSGRRDPRARAIDARDGMPARYGLPASLSLRSSQQVSETALDLQRLIEQRAANKGWEEYLSLDRLTSVSTGYQYVPPASELGDLKGILKTFEKVAADEQFRVLSKLPEFRTTMDLLRQHVENFQQQRRGDLEATIGYLDQQLKSYPNGTHWSDYLELADAETQDDARMRELLTRLDRFSKQRQYEKLTRLPAYRAARTALGEYLGLGGK